MIGAVVTVRCMVLLPPFLYRAALAVSVPPLIAVGSPLQLAVLPRCRSATFSYLRGRRRRGTVVDRRCHPLLAMPLPPIAILVVPHRRSSSATAGCRSKLGMMTLAGDGGDAVIVASLCLAADRRASSSANPPLAALHGDDRTAAMAAVVGEEDGSDGAPYFGAPVVHEMLVYLQ
ncbi:hypothetical protein ACLOJK_030067 [Asimina triloba]